MIKTKTRKLLVLALSLLFAFSLISFVVAKPVNADASVETRVVMKPTAEVRYKEAGAEELAGLRFTAYVTDELYTELTKLQDINGTFKTTDKYAGIVVGKGELRPEELTHETVGVKDSPAVRWAPAKDDASLGLKAYNTVVYDIPNTQTAYAELFTARAYYWDGTEYNYSDDVCVRSIAQVASAELVDFAGNFIDGQEEELQAYVDGVNPVLRIGGTALAENAVNEISIMQTESIDITVEPAGIAFVAQTEVADNAFVSVSGAKITANKSITTEAQIVQIKIGSKTYTVNVTVNKWKDTNIATGVYAAYDEVAYATAFDTLPDSETVNKDAGAVTYLDAEAAKAELGDVAEAQNGVIKWEKKHHAILRIYFQQPVVKATSEGLVIRLKTNEAKYSLYEHTRVRLEGEIGEPTTELYTLMGLTYRQGYLDTVDKWVELVIPGTKMRENANWPAELNYIDIYYTDYVGATFYIDEIFDLSVWSDNDIADGMISEFDKANYVYSFDVGSAGTVTYLDAETAKTELGDVAEAQNGVIKWEVTASKNLRINFQKPVDMSKVSGFTIRLKSDVADLIKVRAIFPGGSTTGELVHIYQGIGYNSTWQKNGNLGVTVPNYTANEWYDLNFNTVGYRQSREWEEEVTEYIDLRISQACTVYLDSIYTTPIFVDTDLADGTYSAFDDAGYVNDFDISPFEANQGSGYLTYLDAEAAKAVLGDVAEAQDGVVRFTLCSSYKYLRVYFEKPIDLSKNSSFSIRIMSDIEKGNNIRPRVQGATADTATITAYANGTAGTYTAGEWYDIKFVLTNYTAATIIEYVDFYIIQGSGNVYFDSVKAN